KEPMERCLKDTSSCVRQLPRGAVWPIEPSFQQRLKLHESKGSALLRMLIDQYSLLRCVSRPIRSSVPRWRAWLWCHAALLAAVLGSVCLASTHASAAHVYQFAAPGVTDLSRREVSSPAATTRDVPREALDAHAVDELRRRIDCGADGP